MNARRFRKPTEHQLHRHVVRGQQVLHRLRADRDQATQLGILMFALVAGKTDHQAVARWLQSPARGGRHGELPRKMVVGVLANVETLFAGISAGAVRDVASGEEPVPSPGPRSLPSLPRPLRRRTASAP